jgi:hypothetical protein
MRGGTIEWIRWWNVCVCACNLCYMCCMLRQPTEMSMRDWIREWLRWWNASILYAWMHWYVSVPFHAYSIHGWKCMYDLYVFIYMSMRVYINTCVHVWSCMYVYMLCMHVYTYVCMYVCMYVYTTHVCTYVCSVLSHGYKRHRFGLCVV